MSQHLDQTHILHVEDNRVDLIKIQSILSASEFSQCHFITANLISDAVAILKDPSVTVDIILLDLGLPDSMGLESLETITKVSAGKPIIITTHADDDALGPLTITMGAHDYITKHRINKTNLARIIKYAIDRNKSELALQKTQAYAQAIVDTAAEAIISIDSEGIIESFNQAAEKIFGYSSQEIIGQNIKLLMPSPYKEEHDGYIKHYASTGQKKIIGIGRKVTALRKNGEIFPMHLSIGEVSLNGRQGFTGIIRDISEQQKIENALKDSEQRFKLAINGSNDGIWDWPDIKHDKQYWSPRFKELIGYAVNDIDASMEKFRQLVHPDDLCLLEQALENHWQHKQKFQLEFRLKTKSQQYRWFAVTANTVLDEEKNTHRMTGSIRDVQERKEHEDSLKKLNTCILDTNSTHEKKLNTILSLAQEYLKLPFGIISQINNETYKVLHVVSPNDEIKAGSCFDVKNTYCTHILSLEKDYVMTLHCAGESDISRHPCYREFELETYIGTPLYVNESLFGTVNFSASYPRKKPFNEEEKAYIRMIAQYIGYEISYQQHLKTLQSLDSARKLEAIGQLAAGIAHEINTPTQYVGDHVEFLQTAFEDMHELLDKYKQGLQGLTSIEAKDALLEEINEFKEDIDLEFLEEEIPKAFDNSLDGVHQVAQIVKAMKGFGHPGNESKESVNLNQALENTITVCRNEWKYIADMKTELQTGLPMVQCFAGELNQVFLNLIVNAAHAIESKLQHTDDTKGVITVQSRIVNDTVEVDIQDTGTGIPEKSRERIFDPFYTTKAVGKGTGQGLAIAHSIIVDKHQGKLDFTTEEGIGTTFHIKLPIEAGQSLREAI